jgi:SulP family sulfate permease
MSDESIPLFHTIRNYGTPSSHTNNGHDTTQGAPQSPAAAICVDHLRRNSVAAMAAAADISARRESQLQQQRASLLLTDRRKNNRVSSTEISSRPLVEEESSASMDFEPMNRSKTKTNHHLPEETYNISLSQRVQKLISQIPAIAIASLLNFMVGIPFGASYFPTELQLPEKEVLGLRMFLFSTMVAQLVFTFMSKFDNATGLQMVENVPFCLALARIVMDEQKQGGAVEDNGDRGAASTLFFLFGLSSILVGFVFYLLGRFELGRIVYFFPSHVLVGCIGGIGAYIVITGLEVTTNTACSLTLGGLSECVVQNFHLLWPVVVFESFLRFLMRMTEKSNGDVRYPLLCPIYYCCITPVFYLGLGWAGMSLETAEKKGYFFPPLSTSGSVFTSDLFNIFTEVNPYLISWRAVIKSIPTMISLTAFSLIHVPINIPAFGAFGFDACWFISSSTSTYNNTIVKLQPFHQMSTQT